MFCSNYILSGILDKCIIFTKKCWDFFTPTFIIEPKDLSLTPDTAGEAMRIMDKIDELREVMRHCNHNNSQNAKCVIGVKDILIKFKYIKALMLNGEEETRNDGVMLFTKTAFLYSAEEQKEFADMLNANELDYIMQIAKQERTIIDKVVTKSKMFEFVKAKMKQLGDEPR